MTNPSDLTRPHVYKPGGDRTLILLHGTGADEQDLLPLGELLSPGATLLSPRGMNRAEGVNRFFERRPDGSFVQETLSQALEELGSFFEAAQSEYSLDLAKAFAVGFSNGGNTALAMLLQNPESLAGVVAFGATNPMPQLTSFPDLSGKKVFIANGTQDPYAPQETTEEFVQQLKAAGAEVLRLSHPGGHTISIEHVTQIAGLL
jgi:phospholipase/carboxylesterase